MELRQARELHQLERAQTGIRLTSLEAEVSYLRQHLSTQISGGVQIGQDLLATLRQVISVPIDRQADPVIEKLLEAIIKRDELALRHQVSTISAEDPSLLDKLHNFILSSVFGGSIGNAAYDWLKVVWPILPK